MTQTVTVQLKAPIADGAQIYNSLTFRPARAKDAIAADKYENNFEKTIAMLASMSGVPFAAFQEIEINDINSIVEKVANLLGEPAASPVGGTS